MEPNLSDDIILGEDLGSDFLFHWIDIAKAKAKPKSVKLMRAKALEEATQDAQDSEALQSSGASPVLLEDIFNFSDSFFDEMPINATAPDDTADPVPLPSLATDCSDRATLIKQQHADTSLATVQQLADKQMRGYEYVNGLLVHCDVTKDNTPVRQIVLPQQRRHIALKLAHNGDLGGHRSVKRTLQCLYPCVTWPNVSRNSAKTLTGRLARWALLLQEFDFKIRYRPGSKNTNADTLSRLVSEDVP